jgi:predicted secreted protein
MGVAGSIMVVIILWWLAFFCLLPIGVRGQWEEGEIEPGSEPGAPAQTRLLLKGIVALAISLTIWAAMFYAINTGAVSLDDIPFLPRFDRAP